MTAAAIPARDSVVTVVLMLKRALAAPESSFCELPLLAAFVSMLTPPFELVVIFAPLCEIVPGIEGTLLTGCLPIAPLPTITSTPVDGTPSTTGSIIS